VLLLDSEAISALAHGSEARRRAVVNVIERERLREADVATSAAIMAEVVRGHPRDAGAYAALRREAVRVAEVTAPVGAGAGRLLGAVGSGSEMAVDAFLVATADDRRPARILTTDGDDITALVAHTTAVDVVVLP
jgi:predicted nucleic acid-binding protein